MEEKIPYKIYLDESEMPKTWLNLRAFMTNKPAPLLSPKTLKPITMDEMKEVFCDELARQELDDVTKYVEIPKEVRDFYKMFRPSPLIRAYCLEKLLDTPAKIYYKFEGNNTSGSHKLNSAIAQAYYAKKQVNLRNYFVKISLTVFRLNVIFKMYNYILKTEVEKNVRNSFFRRRIPEHYHKWSRHR